AAAGLFALDHMIDRLGDDHANARRFAIFLAEKGVPAKPNDVETNIVYVELPAAPFDPNRFMAALKVRGIVINAPRGGRVRFVTHCDVSRTEVVHAATLVAEAFAECRMAKGEGR